jgi:hypothetical protein
MRININLKIYTNINKKMKGVFYNLTYNKINGDIINLDGIDMHTITDNINKIFLDDFGLDFNCNRNHIYNLVKRPNNCNKFLKNYFKVERINAL